MYIVLVGNQDTLQRVGRIFVSIGEMTNVYTILLGNLETKRPLGRPLYRWEIYMEVDFKEMKLEVVELIQLAQDRNRRWALVNTVTKIRVQ
jgi:hypothetical protein